MTKSIEIALLKNRLLTTGFAIIKLLVISGFAEDNIALLINQLYRELMRAVPAELTGSLDSIPYATVNVSPSFSPVGVSVQAVPSLEKSPDVSIEELKREIDKLMQKLISGIPMSLHSGGKINRVIREYHYQWVLKHQS